MSTMIGRDCPCHVDRTAVETGRVRVCLITSPETCGSVSEALGMQVWLSRASVGTANRTAATAVNAKSARRIECPLVRDGIDHTSPSQGSTAALRQPRNILRARDARTGLNAVDLLRSAALAEKAHLPPEGTLQGSPQIHSIRHIILRSSKTICDNRGIRKLS
jgi:hypothetical protein